MDPNILYKKITPKSADIEQTDNICNICMDENENKIIFDCTHTICLICYEKLLNSILTDVVCPFCRGVIEKQDEIAINDNLVVENENRYIRNVTRCKIIELCLAIFFNCIIFIIIFNVR
jgi:hypothetical protein